MLSNQILLQTANQLILWFSLYGVVVITMESWFLVFFEAIQMLGVTSFGILL